MDANSCQCSDESQKVGCAGEGGVCTKGAEVVIASDTSVLTMY